jgi:hypothetical protein
VWSKKAILKLSGITLGTENLRFPEYASRGGAKLQPSDRAALRITPSHVPRTDLFRTYVQLNGYTLTGIKQIVVKGKPRESPLRIDEFPPLSAFIQLRPRELTRHRPELRTGRRNFLNNSACFSRA